MSCRNRRLEGSVGRACTSSGGRLLGKSNEVAGYAELIGRLRPLRSKRIVLEATGEYERALVVALIGVAPLNHDSGARHGYRAIAGGVRNMLYVATRSRGALQRADPRLLSRLSAGGKPAKVALVACMRKMLVMLNGRVGDQHPTMAMA